MTIAAHRRCADGPACTDPTHMELIAIKKPWAFGTIIRVDPVTNPKVPQPDDRRWMILGAAYTSAERQWALLHLAPRSRFPVISHWSSMYGFVEVEE